MKRLFSIICTFILIIICNNNTLSATLTPNLSNVADNSIHKSHIEPLDTLYVDHHIEYDQSLFPSATKKLGKASHFTWGADIGASIDISGNDMSSFDVDVNIGYKNSFLGLAGIGFGVHRSFGNGYNFIPLYANIRTSFRSKPSLFFMDIKGGYSFNTIENNNKRNGIYASIGCGLNLAISDKFKSHIIISYGYFGINSDKINTPYKSINHISYAQIKFGVSF